MNYLYLIIILTIPLVYKLILSLLSYKNTFLPLPQLFEGIMPPSEYLKNLVYNRERIRLSIYSLIFEWICFVFLILYGGLEKIYAFSYSLAFNEAVTGTVFFILLLLFFQIINLPISYYSTFSIEQRHQLNTCTKKRFILDTILSLTISVILLSPILLCLLSFIQTNSFSWLWLWGLITIYQLFLYFIAPIWISPLFNKFTPLPQGDLKTDIDQLCRELQFKIKGVFVVDGSKRSKKANAFFTGIGSSKRIALFDTLLDKCSKEEVIAVLAHEIGHYKYKHILYSVLSSIILTGVGLFIISYLINTEILSYFLPSNTPLPLCLKLLIIGILFTPIQIIINILTSIWSRCNEYQADFYSIMSYPHPTALIDALKKLSVTNKSCLTPHPLVVFLTHSHPTLIQRQNFTLRVQEERNK